MTRNEYIMSASLYQCIALYLSIIALSYIGGTQSIDCFKCISFDGENEWCEDPFHNNYSSTLLRSPCWSGRKNRDGMFPATACIKLSGVFDETGKSMVVRDCALDSGSLTIDTELVRMSHCGGFYFDKQYVRGCVQSCFEDACNGSPNYIINVFHFLLMFTCLRLMVIIIEI